MAKTAHDVFFTQEQAPAQNAHWAAKRRLTNALRQLNNVLVSSVPDEASMLRLAEDLERKSDEFSNSKRLLGRLAYTEHAELGDYATVFNELNPICGLSNPLSPPLNIWLEDGVAKGLVTMGWVYEGPPMCVHGGYVAALFDEFLGMAQLLGKQPGMTGSLTIRYQKPTPLNTELELTGWLDRIDGRKTFMHGEIKANGEITATAEGLFIQPRAGMFKKSESDG